MFVLVSCSFAFQNLLCFVHGQSQQRTKKHTVQQRKWRVSKPVHFIIYICLRLLLSLSAAISCGDPINLL